MERWKHVSRVAGALIVTILCSGCVPILPHRYFRPTAPGGRVVKNSCTHTYNSIELQQPHALVEMRVLRLWGQPPSIEIRWEIEPGSVVTLTDHNAQIFVGNNAAPIYLALALTTTQDPHQPMQPATTPMVGDYLAIAGFAYRRSVWMY